ncbi:tandem-type lipoprotein [Staphylococcus epidermidis]|uniref:tandem-type lipoprotein n=1 Tax=Staphylococcus epidermidis TaxID=1282 RepID=UPI0024808929|nr:tandem-type lipoprotein [Staphylococcus epidermidis]
MKHSKKLFLCISFLLITIFIGGCGFMNKDDSKETEIKQNFNKMLNVYPTKNLEDFYDKEGYRDEEFDKNDKGTWIIRSEMTKQPKGKIMTSKGMVLHMNRNTRSTTGYYVIRKISEDNKNKIDDEEKKYPIKMVNNKIIPTKKINDSKLKNEIENFKFFVQYGSFKNSEDYKEADIEYNPNAPNYSAQYSLSNDDYNIKQLRKRYDIKTKQTPRLLMRGAGDPKGSSVGYKNLEFTFVENNEENIYFTDSINFNPSKGE